MKAGVFILLALVMLVSCTSPTATTPVAQDTVAPVPEIPTGPTDGCFAYTNKGDSVWLKLELFPRVATGVLVYKLAGKERTAGTFDGQLRGDTLVADYTFRSKGKTMVRQIVFLLSSQTAKEASGPMKDYEGKMVFADLGRVDFTTGRSLVPVSCDDQGHRFRTE